MKRVLWQSGRFVASLLGAGTLLAAWVLTGDAAVAQVSVITEHNNIARTGQNVSETILTPSNVNTNQFGKLFSQPVNGEIYAQPLYVHNVAIPGQGAHNVVYVATTSGQIGVSTGEFAGDFVYAFDADTNGGVNGKPLWQVSLLTNTASAGTYSTNNGVLGTPVIDLASMTMYLVSSEFQGTAPIYRFHALDITTGAEKFGGPILIRGSVPGTGSGSVNGVLTFDPTYQIQRPGLLEVNGIIYIAFGSIGDQGAWHGWIFSYYVNGSAQKLQLDNIFCTTPNGSGGGVWMSGAGLAAEVNNSAKPYGRMFVATGNGSNSATPPYNNTMSYGMSVIDLDLSQGVMTVKDQFTPYDEAALDAQDGDLGSGGPVLLPTQTLASGKKLNPLLQIGKSGMFYVLDRDNSSDGSNNASTEYSPAGLGGFDAAADKIVQEVQTPIRSGFNWGAGVWGSEAYWNNNIYSGGTNVANQNNLSGSGNNLIAYSFINGVLSSAPTSQSQDLYHYAGPTPAVSANGTENGIVWALHSGSNDPLILTAYDATNLANKLYTSSDNAARDNAGLAVEYVNPTIVNGKVYVGAISQLNVFGLLNAEPTAPTPVISPSSASFTGTVTISIADSLGGATIYYTTDGSTPNSYSSIYSGSFPVSTDETITAVASANGYLQSVPASVSYTSTTAPTNPVLSLAGGTYTGTQSLTITDSTPGTVIHYTIDGPAPTASSAVYAKPLAISASQTVRAIAISSSGYNSAVVSATYTIYNIDFSQGFTLAEGPIQFNGSTDLDDFRLQLTNGGENEAGSAFFATPVNIQSFTTNFTFQLSNPAGDGMTFTIQNVGSGALGGVGGSLGYGGIGKSVAIKFDLFSNAGEGVDSTGLYLNGAQPTVPSINLSGTGINLHSGDFINAIVTYDGTTLTLNLVDTITQASWSQAFTVDIPATVGGNTAYVGFTGGTGGDTSSQKLTSWTYVAGPPAPNYSAGFNAVASLVMNGKAAYSLGRLRLTDGNSNEASSAFFGIPVNVQQFTTSFQFQLTNANADGFTFAIQGAGPTALGQMGGSLGYGGIGQSVAIKFDLFSNAGEGPDSTGLFTNGAYPTNPSINLNSTGINFHSGDVFNALLTYNGTTLTVVLTDTVTNASATQTYAVNIPNTVGGTTAYVGFTGGSGGATAIQDILNWIYSSGYGT